jgi:serine/threonine protein phosphatase PrpC
VRQPHFHPTSHSSGLAVPQLYTHMHGLLPTDVAAVQVQDALVATFASLEVMTAANGINVATSGASLSMLAVVRSTLHVAFVGSCRVVVAEAEGRSEIVRARQIFCDHKLSSPAERDRCASTAFTPPDTLHQSHP